MTTLIIKKKYLHNPMTHVKSHSQSAYFTGFRWYLHKLLKKTLQVIHSPPFLLLKTQSFIWDHSFSVFAKFSEKLTFLTSYYTHKNFASVVNELFLSSCSGTLVHL